MRLTDKVIHGFREIYREEYGKEISRKDASGLAFEIVSLYEALAQRLPNDDADRESLDDSPHQSIGFRA